MATATQTVRAGEFRLDSLDTDNQVYVPQQCIGIQRCPLLVSMFGDTPQGAIANLRQAADTYGVVILAPDRQYGWNVPDSVYPTVQWATPTLDPRSFRNVDAAMQQLLRQVAIAPDKIAILGRCDGGDVAAVWGGNNLDIFSRILVVSGEALSAAVGRPNSVTEFFLDDGLTESYNSFRATAELRRAGHPVTHVLSLRGHENQEEDYDRILHWLVQSWAIPQPAARPIPAVVADSMPLLTQDAVARMIKFWTFFSLERDSVLSAGRRAHLREVVVPIGSERPSVLMVDMAALAAQYPSVAADLQRAKLTGQEHDAYRVALISARVARDVVRGVSYEAALVDSAITEETTSRLPDSVKVAKYRAYFRWRTTPVTTIDATSVQGKNIEFLEAHRDEFDDLEATKMWSIP